jgi:hypothetical protein
VKLRKLGRSNKTFYSLNYSTEIAEPHIRTGAEETVYSMDRGIEQDQRVDGRIILNE